MSLRLSAIQESMHINRKAEVEQKKLDDFEIMIMDDQVKKTK